MNNNNEQKENNAHTLNINNNSKTMIDTEALLNDESKFTETKRNTDRTWLGFAALTTMLLTFASLGVFWNHHHGMPQHRGSLAIVVEDVSMAAWDVGKKIHPPHPKKLHHGEVLYTTVEDPDMGRYYKREFLIPCGYGLLVFNIGAADQAMPFDYDVFDDGYVYSDNGGLCFLYPSYRAFQNDTSPFWMPNDATSFRVPLGHQMVRISTRVNEHAHCKPTTDKIKKRGGDFLIMAKHNFYTPSYYRGLKSIVNSWNAVQGEPPSWQEMQVQLELMALELDDEAHVVSLA